MFLESRRVLRARVPQTMTPQPLGETPPPLPLRTPYLSYLLCAAHRLDLLMAKRAGDSRAPAIPPFC